MSDDNGPLVRTDIEVSVIEQLIPALNKAVENAQLLQDRANIDNREGHCVHDMYRDDAMELEQLIAYFEARS